MCLDAHAHGMRTDHEIFNQPVKVNLTLEEQPTPGSYAYYKEGADLGESMSMWRVQTEGYLTHPGQLIGIVSRNSGFFDSPDVEWISGGVNSKGPEAVAIGRHGNFFHWGFAASPTYLTDEAKDVFCNAVHYIAKFEGKTPVARKVSGVMIRSAIDDAIESMSEEGYAATVTRYEEIRADIEKGNAEIQAKIDNGEEVSKMEKQSLGFPPVETPSRTSRAERLVSAEMREELGDDPEKLSKYLAKIKPYVYPKGWYELNVDVDLMEIGIANNDPALLEKAIEMLGADSEEVKTLGQTLLTRYTSQSFETQKDWANWLEAKRSKLFFTEAGGYKWLVNERVTKDVTRKPLREPVLENPVSAEASARTPFASSMSVEKDKDGYVLNVNVDIFDGWHAYDRVTETSAYRPIKLKLELPEGVTQVGEWDRPISRPSADTPGVTTFTGNVDFRCRISIDDLESAAEIVCKVSYQVCDERSCRPPSTEKLATTIKP